MKRDTQRALDDIAWQSKIRIEPQPTAAETMTELQLRLWCLWMCEEFADLSRYGIGELATAMDGSDDLRMRMAVSNLGGIGAKGALLGWGLSERMA